MSTRGDASDVRGRRIANAWYAIATDLSVPFDVRRKYRDTLRDRARTRAEIERVLGAGSDSAAISAATSRHARAVPQIRLERYAHVFRGVRGIDGVRTALLRKALAGDDNAALYMNVLRWMLTGRDFPPSVVAEVGDGDAESYAGRPDNEILRARCARHFAHMYA
jgi:hypothetical protein